MGTTAREGLFGPGTSEDSARRKTRVVAGCLLLGALGYAILRYHLVGDVPWTKLPLYTTNKALAWASATCLAAAVASGPLRRLAKRQSGWLVGLHSPTMGRIGAGLALMHVWVALLVTTPSVLPSWFDAGGGALTTAATVATLFGALAAALLLQSWRDAAQSTEADRLSSRRLRTLLIVLVAAHTAAMGVQGWLAPTNWPGALPPITGLAFLTLTGSLAIRWRGRRR